MINDPHTHLHLQRLTTAETVARQRHRRDHLPRRPSGLQRLWATLRRRPVAQTSAAHVRSVAAATFPAEPARCDGATRSTPHAA